MSSRGNYLNKFSLQMKTSPALSESSDSSDLVDPALNVFADNISLPDDIMDLTCDTPGPSQANLVPNNWPEENNSGTPTVGILIMCSQHSCNL